MADRYDDVGKGYEEHNDLRHHWPVPVWLLCEGCGYHLFTPQGERVCERGDAHASEETLRRILMLAPCARC